MADIFRAYRLLNKVYDLGLSDVQMSAAEMMAKVALAKEQGLPVDVKNVHEWEFFGDIQPRRNLRAKPIRVGSLQKYLDAYALQGEIKVAAASKRGAKASAKKLKPK